MPPMMPNFQFLPAILYDTTRAVNYLASTPRNPRYTPTNHYARRQKRQPIRCLRHEVPSKKPNSPIRFRSHRERHDGLRKRATTEPL